MGKQTEVEGTTSSGNGPQRPGGTFNMLSGMESSSRSSDTQEGISSTSVATSLRPSSTDLGERSTDKGTSLLKYQEEIDESQSGLTTAEPRCESSTGWVADGFDRLAGQTAEVQISASEGRQQSEGRGDTVGLLPESAESDVAESGILMCIECEDQHAELMCLSCDEPFCRPCWASLHRRGKRAYHKTRPILGKMMPAPTSAPEPPVPPEGPAVKAAKVGGVPKGMSDGIAKGNGLAAAEAQEADEEDELEDGEEREEELDDGPRGNGKRHTKRRCMAGLGVGLDGTSVLEESRFIPLRLDDRERSLLAMLTGALNFSEYTDRVDVFSRWSKAKTINAELRRALAALAGMMVAGDARAVDKGAALLDNLEDNEDLFAEIFEVGRRFKVTNPEKFRSFYGKMMYMLQDAAQARSGLNLVKDIKMVYGFVEKRSGLALLEDRRVLQATAEISGASMTREEVREKVKSKRETRESLLQEYASETFSRGEIMRVLDSISDANNYIAFNVAPVERMLQLLRSNFDPEKPHQDWSLKLQGARKRFSSSSLYNSGYGSFGSYGYGGGYGMSMSMFGPSTAVLSHDHRTQYKFVMQSLRLWSEAMRNMYRLWYFADSDLLSGRASYRLCNTGQGLNRVQSCPSVSSEMRRILGIVQSECGPWVGLSVVHLGDRDVPNALMFIDKYTQIPRILNPIVEVVRSLGDMALDPVLGQYVDVGWGGVHNAKMAVLSDFFKGGFDGSGDDGGSCIDGRLTSAWNWCSLLHKKPFANIFSLAGQYGFDGGWGDGLAA